MYKDMGNCEHVVVEVLGSKMLQQVLCSQVQKLGVVVIAGLDGAIIHNRICTSTSWKYRALQPTREVTKDHRSSNDKGLDTFTHSFISQPVFISGREDNALHKPKKIQLAALPGEKKNSFKTRETMCIYSKLPERLAIYSRKKCVPQRAPHDRRKGWPLIMEGTGKARGKTSSRIRQQGMCQRTPQSFSSNRQKSLFPSTQTEYIFRLSMLKQRHKHNVGDNSGLHTSHIILTVRKTFSKSGDTSRIDNSSDPKQTLSAMSIEYRLLTRTPEATLHTGLHKTTPNEHNQTRMVAILHYWKIKSVAYFDSLCITTYKNTFTMHNKWTSVMWNDLCFIVAIRTSKWTKLENLYLFSKIFQQDKYKFLANFFYHHDKDEIISPSEALRNSVFIFDYVWSEPQGTIQHYFSFGKHLNVDCFARIPKHNLRDNTHTLIVFRVNNFSLQHIYNDHILHDMSFTNFKEICFCYWKDKITQRYKCVKEKYLQAKHAQMEHVMSRMDALHAAINTSNVKTPGIKVEPYLKTKSLTLKNTSPAHDKIFGVYRQGSVCFLGDSVITFLHEDKTKIYEYFPNCYSESDLEKDKGHVIQTNADSRSGSNDEHPKLHLLREIVGSLIFKNTIAGRFPLILWNNPSKLSFTTEGMSEPLRIPGSEFFNVHFKELMTDYGINHYVTYSGMKVTVIEQFNNYIKQLLYKHFTSRGSYNWIKILLEIREIYNFRYHRTINKKSPMGVKNNDLLKTKCRDMKENHSLKFVQYVHISKKPLQVRDEGVMGGILHPNPDSIRVLQTPRPEPYLYEDPASHFRRHSWRSLHLSSSSEGFFMQNLHTLTLALGDSEFTDASPGSSCPWVALMLKAVKGPLKLLSTVSWPQVPLSSSSEIRHAVGSLAVFALLNRTEYHSGYRSSEHTFWRTSNPQHPPKHVLKSPVVLQEGGGDTTQRRGVWGQGGDGRGSACAIAIAHADAHAIACACEGAARSVGWGSP
ncbi:hypothetical protein PR048_010996, partial [Dryococelus australis]